MTRLSTTVRDGLAAAGLRWRSFWFQPQQMYTLGLVRIGFSALVIVWTLWLIPVRTDMLGPDGITPKQPSIPDTWGLFAIWNSNEAILLGIAALLVAAIALLVGWHTRIAAVVVFVLVLSLERRSPWMFNSGDVVVRIEAFLLAIAPCGRALSLDQRRREGKFWSAQTLPNWPIRLLQVQLSIIYLFAVQAKLSGRPWLDGTAVSYVLRIEDMKRIPAPDWLSTNALAMNAATWSVLVIELSVGILVWFPRFRPWVLAAGVVMHMTIDLNIQIGIFTYAMFVMYLAWVSPETVKGLPQRLRRAKEDGAKPDPGIKPDPDPRDHGLTT
jgi:hypothetical protein